MREETREQFYQIWAGCVLIKSRNTILPYLSGYHLFTLLLYIYNVELSDVYVKRVRCGEFFTTRARTRDNVIIHVLKDTKTTHFYVKFLYKSDKKGPKKSLGSAKFNVNLSFFTC